MKAIEQSNGFMNDGVSRMSEFVRRDDSAGNDTSFVMENVLISIVGGMSAKNKEIVLDAVQYAKTMAGYSVKHVEAYEIFAHEMQNCGFPATRSRYGNYEAKDSRLTMDKVGLEILTGLIGGAAVGPLTGKLLLGLVGQAFESLKSQDEPLELFQRSAKQFGDVSFAIVSGVETAEGDVLLAIAFVSLKVNVSATNVLFWDFNTSALTIERGEHITQLNPRQWRRAEKHVDKYLTDQLEVEFSRIK
jgi:hypothetical protein